MTRKKTHQTKVPSSLPGQPVSPNIVDDVAAPQRISQAFPIVGIGASAGGLAALEAFFTHFPADTGVNMAFVVVQHLAPNHKSLLGELVQRFTRMTVTEITDEVIIEPNHVYIIPPNQNLQLFHGKLHLTDFPAASGIHLPIDAFFRSLAADQQERAICIVLSGAGSDGALGVRAVQEVGGMVMAQSPESAEYASMPSSALATGPVDYVLPPEEMPAALTAYLQHVFARPARERHLPTEGAGDLLQKIFLLLRTQTRHDFSGYKRNSILRRIERRMAIHRLDTLHDYVHFLEETPQEAVVLFRELLIGVTRFFRDPEAFDAVNAVVIPQLFEHRQAGDAVRIWVPACSTGEEAYSLAILASEYMRERYAGVKVIVFATDIDAVAIERARSGVYPANIAADVSPERLARNFQQHGNSYTVKQSIRDMVIFAEQDVIIDPPFSHVDAISCRNLLIYLGAELQQQLLPVFHYALNPRGFLFLGTSETVGDFSDLFQAVDRKWKIYQKIEVVTPHRLPAALPAPLAAHPSPRALPKQSATEAGANLRTLGEQYLLAKHTPPSVLINGEGEILYVYGSTGHFLEPASGAANLNITRMAREGLRLDLLTIIRKVVTRKEAMHRGGLCVTVDDRRYAVNLTVTPLASAPGLFMVVFDETPASAAKQPAVPSPVNDRDQRIIALEQELQAKEEYLQSQIEELATGNEELQSANEELQSTNEEMDTSKEELQSVNEELSTVNAELQKKIEELSHANDDMSNLLAGTEIGTVFVDAHLRIQRFTPAITTIINLLPPDIGRPLTHLTANLVNYDTLAADAQQVFDTLVAKEAEVQTAAGRWYLLRILPYRTQNNAIAGVVITFIDITRQKALQEQIRQLQLDKQAHAYAESIVDTVREPLLVLDADLRVVSANSAFYQSFQVNAEATIGARVYDLGNGEWNIPSLRTLLEDILPRQTSFNDYVVRHTFAGSGPRTMRLNAREVRRLNGEPRMILLAIEDITEEEVGVRS